MPHSCVFLGKKKQNLPEEKAENIQKSTRERRSEKIFENLNPRKQKFCPRKKRKTVPEKATK